MVKLNTIDVMVQCYLKDRLLQKNKESVIFSMNRLMIGKYFRLIVGNERTRSLEIVNKLLFSPNDNEVLLLKTNNEFNQFFRGLSEPLNEQFAINYLSACYFIKILNNVLSNYQNK